MAGLGLRLILGLVACGPYAAWPDPSEVFPNGPITGLDEEAFLAVRWETETHAIDDPVFVGSYARKALEHRTRAAPEIEAHFAAQRIPRLVGSPDATFAGDIMYRSQDNWASYAQPTAALFADSEVGVGNLETPTSSRFSTAPRAHGLYAFNAPPAMLDSLPFDVLQVNNNHSLDVGDEGLADTLDAITDRDRTPLGHDGPLRLDVDGRTLELFAYTWGLNDGRTSERYDLGVVRFGQVDATDLSRIEADLRRSAAEQRVVLVHWGFEYEYYPDVHFMKLARDLVRAGADVIVGHGPHVVQPAELCHVNQPAHVPGIGTCSVRTDDGVPRDALVLYSLGDFGSDIPTTPTKVGLLAHIAFADRGVAGAAWSAVASTTEQNTAWIRPLQDVLTDRETYPDELERLQRLLGDWQR